MNQRLVFLAACGAALGCTAPDPTTNDSATGPAAAATAEDPLQGGIPAFESVEDAIAYAIQEPNLHAFRGIVMGSERYRVELPSGQSTSNWRVQCFFGAAFRSFGTEAYAAVVPLLGHEDLFVQVGAAGVLGQPLADAGYRFRLADTQEQRQATVDGMLAYLERVGTDVR